MMCVSLKSHEGNNDIIFLRVEVRGGTKSSRFEVVICLDTLTSPYRYIFSLILFGFPLYAFLSH